MTDIKVVKLAPTREQDLREALAKRIADVPGDADGFALVWFRRSVPEKGQPIVTTSASWFVHDPMDAFALPDLAKYRISKSLDESGD